MGKPARPQARKATGHCGDCIACHHADPHTHHAGVGVASVYRHFPDKDQLVEGLFEQRIEEPVTRAQLALADPDPWRALAAFIRDATEMQARDRAIKDLMTGGHVGLERISRIRDRLMAMGEALIDRAHASGRLRADIQASDLSLIQAIIGPLIDAGAALTPMPDAQLTSSAR